MDQARKYKALGKGVKMSEKLVGVKFDSEGKRDESKAAYIWKEEADFDDALDYANFFSYQKNIDFKNKPHSESSKTESEKYKHMVSLLKLYKSLGNTSLKISNLKDYFEKRALGSDDPKIFNDLVSFLNKIDIKDGRASFRERHDFKEWKKENIKRQHEERTNEINESQQNQNILVIKKIKETRETIENAHEKELLDLVMKDGGVEISASLMPEISGDSAGITEMKDKSRLPYTELNVYESVFSNPREFLTGEKAFKYIMSDNNINEAVGLHYPERDIYEDVITETRGILGFGKRKVTNERKKGKEPVLHKDIVRNGKEEPACELVYQTYQERLENTGEKEKGNFAYKEYSNRDQVLRVKISLPASVAERIYEQAKNNPLFLRMIIEKAIVVKLGISKETWKNGTKNGGFPLRPPYEKWREDHNGISKIMFRKEGELVDLNNIKTF